MLLIRDIIDTRFHSRYTIKEVVFITGAKNTGPGPPLMLDSVRTQTDTDILSTLQYRYSPIRLVPDFQRMSAYPYSPILHPLPLPIARILSPTKKVKRNTTNMCQAIRDLTWSKCLLLLVHRLRDIQPTKALGVL